LALAHFEYRHQRSPPQHMLPIDRPDLGEPVSWQRGILPEQKYQGFRNDLLIGSFHPNHRAKWTAHELCHGLVGFAWRPDASPFFHALAARLAELLPVALFYFFDEIELRRCPDHEDGGPLFGTFCAACEAAASEGPRERRACDERFLQEGRAFVDRELAAVAKSIRLGRSISSPWANLDLASDGLAYAAMQSTRLRSPEFARYMDLFFPPGFGCHEALAALEARVVAVRASIVDDAPLPAWHGRREHRMAQDVGWRLCEVLAETAGEVHGELEALVERLAASPAALSEVIAGYEALFDEYVLPEPEQLFAVGYPLPRGYGFDFRQIDAGIESACPQTRMLLQRRPGGDSEAMIRAFTDADKPRRQPLGRRFANWLTDRDDDLAGLARAEAAIAHPPPASAEVLSLSEAERVSESGSTWRIAPDVVLLQVDGTVVDQLGLDGHEGARETGSQLAIRRDAAGETVILDLEPGAAATMAALADGRSVPASKMPSREDLAVLAAHHLIVPERWPLN
jgi:hypothetical protein